MDIVRDPLVSIIVPVYNSEKYLSKTVESLIKQTYKNYEIILIDDGSTDGSSQICDKLKNMYNCIIVIHQSNKGICNARNVGMSIATGAYIAFCDDDDIAAPRLLEICVSEAEKECADVIRFRRRHELIKHKRRIGAVYPYFNKEVLEDFNWEDYLRIMEQCGYGVWAGLYKTEYLKSQNIFFDENVMYGYEDHIFTAEACGNAKKVVMLPEVLYKWVQRIDGSTSCRKGYKIYNNRVNGIYLWYKKEICIQKKMNVSNDEINLRKYDYLACVIDEIKRSGITGTKAIEMLNNEKNRLKYDRSYSIKSKKNGLYKKILYLSIQNNQIMKYSIIQFIHKILRVLKIG